jgi:hypothetical protein
MSQSQASVFPADGIFQQFYFTSAWRKWYRRLCSSGVSVSQPPFSTLINYFDDQLLIIAATITRIVAIMTFGTGGVA